RQAIEDERSRYLELFEFAPGGYLVTDTQGIILEANSAATSLLCVKKDLLVGKPLALFVHSHERSSFRTRLAQLHKEPEPKNINWEFQLQASNQQAFPAAITVGKMTSQRRKTSELRWLIRDITKRKQLEEELQKADKLESLGILAGGIAHDFNNFLTIILGNLSLAKMYAKGDIKVSKHLHEMEDAFAQTRNLTEQLLTFAKGGEPLTRAVSIDSFIRDVSSFALSGSNTLYEFFLTADLPAVEIDEGQITQVISNLLINADQAMPTGGTIKISAESLVIQGENTLPLQPGHYVAVTIADEGKGIAKKALPKIFDPFFTTKEQGSGLGLTICYSIIKRHGGHIAVKSVEGQGTSFTVYLPASRNDAREEAIDDTLCLGEGKILFMDDEERVRQTAGEMLSALGYEVEFANDGAEAVKKYQDAFFTDSPYDVVITDITVRGGMGGQLAVRELLKIDPHVKAIVSSGYSNDALLSAYKKHGFCGMVAKPYRLQELGEALARVIESKKQNNE
ncbi:MAG: ATP-binding protein, partial [Firmicutes bacterium]|nr:ATP-binding protein [Bacillota bacterium]